MTREEAKAAIRTEIRETIEMAIQLFEENQQRYGAHVQHEELRFAREALVFARTPEPDLQGILALINSITPTEKLSPALNHLRVFMERLYRIHTEEI
ncbi:MAG: hypothetical protein MUF87_16130 [Anaerolineae bacterium]|nr:hypothetical protein [Anaerolineae bacterium]